MRIDSSGDLFRVILKKGAETLEAAPEEFAAYGGKFGIKSEKKDRETVSILEIEISGDYTLYSVKFPIVKTCEGAVFDNLLVSSSWGDNIERPAKTIMDLWSSSTVKFAQDTILYVENEVCYTYPSIMAMQYMVLYNAAKSLYIASYDTGGSTKTYHAKALNKFDLELSVGHYPFVKDGKWVSPECSIAESGGGWHKGAELYASRMSGVYPAPDYPEWMRDSYHGWTEFVMKYEGKPLKFKFSDLPGMYNEVNKNTGMNHLFIAGWMDDGHDTNYPNYMPHEPGGTPADIKAGMEAIGKMGGRVSFYTNSRLVDNKGVYYNNGGKNAVCANEDGKDYTESYGTKFVYAVACPGCREYIEQMCKVTRRLAGEYGVHGMFTDQISCNFAPFCHNPNHWHTTPGNNFLPGIDKLLAEIRRTHKEINPDFHTFAEGCHERFNRYYDVNQGHGEDYTWQIGKSMPEQFSYTYPDRIVTGLCNDKRQMYHAMAQFKPLDIKPSCYADKSNHKPLRDYIALREKYRQFFLHGRFIDDEGFAYTNNTRLFASRAEDGSVCVCLWIPGAEEGSECASSVLIPAQFSSFSAILPVNAELNRNGQWLEVKWTGAVCYLASKNISDA
ncbi:MAG: DUF6259 domain-containing protein [Treponema sp.]|jgi:hypothetical protein|nr:DUF6259 domain-containing protein [Treponema sp.]